MIPHSVASPDVKLVLDFEGVIQDASLSASFAGEKAEAWVGQAWADTVRQADGVHLLRMLDAARAVGVSAFIQVVQRLPSGLEIPMEYTTIRLGQPNRLVAVGKNLRAITELQNRLVEAQQAMERDYWKLREVETRYRLLFNASSEAVLLLEAGDLALADWNPAAAQALGLAQHRPRASGTGKFPDLLLSEERERFGEMLRQVRERGKAPGMLLRLGPEREPWLARVSVVASARQELFLLQLTHSGLPSFGVEQVEAIPIEELLERGPDGFVVINEQGAILRANGVFIEMTQMASARAVIGEPLGRWLRRPGADLGVLLANVLRLGAVRLFATTLRGELGSEIEVEISAAGNAETEPRYIGVFIRDVERRLSTRSRTDAIGQLLESLTKQIGKTTLRQLADDTVQIIERHYIEAALELTGGNRTAAAELLGLSRQSLYVKLNRYALDGDDKTADSG